MTKSTDFSRHRSSPDLMEAWQRETQERKRLAILASQEQQREAHHRLALDGLSPVALHDLVDDLAEVSPIPVVG